jgi:hypothetical protein
MAKCAGDGVSVSFCLGDAEKAPPRITKSDAAFLADGLEFAWGLSAVDTFQLNDLFEKVSFFVIHVWDRLEQVL